MFYQTHMCDHVIVLIVTIIVIIISMTKLLDADRLKGVQLFH